MLSRLLLAVLIVALGACAGQPSVTPPTTPASPAGGTASATPAAIGDPDVAAVVAYAQAHVGQSLGDDDLSRDQLVDETGLRSALGDDADAILALVARTEAAVRAKDPLGPGFGATSSLMPEPRIVYASAILASLKIYPPPLDEFRDYLASSVDAIGRPGEGTIHRDESTSDSQTSGAVSSTSEQRTTLDVSVAGSVVSVAVDRSVHDVATDVPTGATILDSSWQSHIAGKIDVCPSAAGIVPASASHSFSASASTFAGARGRVGSHSTSSVTTDSKFEGHVDDAATLGNVTQDSTRDGKFKRTAAADGGPEATHEGEYTSNVAGIGDGVPAAHDFGISGGDWSNLTSHDVNLSGDATIKELTDAVEGAAVDYALVDQAYVKAQEVWRHTRCVIITSPQYAPLSAFANNATPTHTEDVEKGSTTEFDVATDHRFGQSVSALIKVDLSGKDTIDPREVPKPPGTLTYAAPDEDGQDATVTLETTSKQGIGRLVLKFHTGAKKLKLAFNGKMTTSALGASYRTTVAFDNLLLSPQPDGSYVGSAPTTTTIRLLGDIPCPTAFKEQGTVTLRATRQVVEDQSLPRRWYVTLDPGSTFTTSGTCLGMSLGQVLQAGPSGFTGAFLFAIGQMTFDQEGETLKIKKTITLGPSKNAVDVTVKAEVISEAK